MKYKVYLDAVLCDKFSCNLIKAMDLGIDAYGIPQEISFTIDQEPTKELIDKIIKIHESTKNYKEIDSYFANVKLNRIEMIDVG